MSRNERSIEERGEPKLMFLRCGGPSVPIELVIVEADTEMIYELKDSTALRLIAEASSALLKR